MIEIDHILKLTAEAPMRGMYDYPVWEIRGFDLPEIDLILGNKIAGHDFRYDLELGENEPSAIDEFFYYWQKHTNDILDHIKVSDLPVLDQMWKGSIKNLNSNENIQLFCDKPGLHMGEHIDNRHVVGVLIINLQDNNAGTYINELEYNGPTEKGTGMFILNNYNSSHSIHLSNNNEQDRYIGYHTLSFEDFKWN